MANSMDGAGGWLRAGSSDPPFSSDPCYLVGWCVVLSKVDAARPRGPCYKRTACVASFDLNQTDVKAASLSYRSS